MGKLNGWNIGFIGLGLMGKPMAQNLLAAGANMFIHNRSWTVVDELVKEGMNSSSTPFDVSKRSDIILLMLTNTPAVETVLNGSTGVIAGLSKGDIVVDMSTTKVNSTRKFSFAVRAKGAEYIDAPVSGGTMGAKSQTLTIMAGGTTTAIECTKPIFDVLGSKLTHVGDVGSGQIAKAANQMIVGLYIGAVAEALTLVKKAGADPALVHQAIQGGFADSKILKVHGQRMVDNEFVAGAHSTTQRKDMDQAIELAHSLGLKLPATLLNRDLYDQMIEAGHGNLDHAALIKAIDPDEI
jgi:3-hydroxyisobutyrate dehydrogenase-like beta-hydroxyacid dehydrogenase